MARASRTSSDPSTVTSSPPSTDPSRTFEVTDLVIPAGTSDPYVLGDVELPIGSTALASSLLVLDAPPSVSDNAQLAMWDPITAAPANGLTGYGAASVVAPYVWSFAADVILWATTAGSLTEDPPPDTVTLQAVLAWPGAPTQADISIAQARIKLMIF